MHTHTPQNAYKYKQQWATFGGEMTCTNFALPTWNLSTTKIQTITLYVTFSHSLRLDSFVLCSMVMLHVHLLHIASN